MNTEFDTHPHAASPEPQELNEVRWIKPVVDIFENEAEVLLIAEVPGVQLGDVDLHLHKGELTLLAYTRREAPGDPERVEFEPVGYRRTFAVRRGLDEARITAGLQRGLLTIHLPKSDALKPRQIPIS